MSKGWKTRLTETWTVIDGMNGEAGRVNGLKGYHNALTDQQRKAISTAMSQGKYSDANTKGVEKGYRAYRRALILILMAKSNSGNADTDLQRALQVLQGNMPDDMAMKRAQAELANLPLAITAMHARGNADLGWAGWDGAIRRPLLAGCAIGRRGANGPGTLGCFVTGAGGAIYILSNRHVLYQGYVGGGNAVATDAEVIQPPHQLGGSYFDTVATLHGDLPTHDAALARVKPGITCSNTTPEGTAIAGSNAVGAGATISKRGCASTTRWGTVTNHNSPTVNVGGGTILQDQLLIDRDDNLDHFPARIFQIQGDSGSVVLNAANEVVALAHGQAGATTLQATHIAPILQHFNVQVLVGQAVAA